MSSIGRLIDRYRLVRSMPLAGNESNVVWEYEAGSDHATSVRHFHNRCVNHNTSSHDRTSRIDLSCVVSIELLFLSDWPLDYSR